jgi:hypothetical protein
VIQALEHLHNSHEALNSNPKTANKTKQNNPSAQKGRIKRQPTEREQIFTSHSSDKGLISRIYKQIQKLNTKK